MSPNLSEQFDQISERAHAASDKLKSAAASTRDRLATDAAGPHEIKHWIETHHDVQRMRALHAVGDYGGGRIARHGPHAIA